MRFLSIACGGLLLAAALPSHAQTSPTETAAPRYYVGLAAYSSYYQQLGHPDAGPTGYLQSSSFRLPVQLTAGYQLSPRLAVQVGVAYSSGTSHYGLTTGYSSPTPGTPSPYYTTAGTSTQTQVATSILGRYTLTANPANRLQFDALGGFTLERSILHNRGTDTNSAQGASTSTDYDYSATRNMLLLTGGVGARYRLSSRFELTYDFTVNKALTNSYTSPANSHVLTTSHALGLRYRFGR